ncbi:MAG: hypothetical protein JXR94_16360 [Candidatus Hydrogenedentes bacterium]|nr:hypothetical protein [Candidatus Hydrogenedentota bacterium]
MSEPLPAHPSLEHLKKHAKSLLKRHKQRDPDVCPVLSRLPRFAWTPPDAILDAEVSLQEIHHALALQYGFTNWAELGRHIDSASWASAGQAGPSAEQALAHYLREDVSTALWEMAQRRVLKLHYRTDGDMRKPHTKAEHIGLHCEPDPEAFRHRVRTVLEAAAPSRQPFFPFFGMGPVVNEPGHPDRPAGWDLRFEVDLEWRPSFRALIPVLAVLDRFQIPALAKYSGNRSLHVILPAEAFPPAMRRGPVHSEWMRVFERLGGFLGRFSPALSTTVIGLAKEMTLTAPYSLHRFAGGVSLPLGLDQALEFAPQRGRLDAFPGVSWRPADLDGDAAPMERLLEFAARAEAEPAIVLELAADLFKGKRWTAFVQNAVPAEATERPVLAALMMGLTAARSHFAEPAGDPALRERLLAALDVIDRPGVKTAKFLNTARPIGFTPFQSYEFRRPVCEILERWVLGGCAEALSLLAEMASSDIFAQPIMFAVRILALLPEPAPALVERLIAEWRRSPHVVDCRRAFLALALGERASRHPDALRALNAANKGREAAALAELLAGAGVWQAEERPDLAIATLMLAFGIDTVASWAQPGGSPEASRIVQGAFGERQSKFTFGLKTVENRLRLR